MTPPRWLVLASFVTVGYVVPTVFAFVPRGSSFAWRRQTACVGRKQRSSCAVGQAWRKGERQAAGASVVGRGSRGGGAPLNMMFDTLAERMTSVANLFTGQQTITESRCVAACERTCWCKAAPAAVLVPVGSRSILLYSYWCCTRTKICSAIAMLTVWRSSLIPHHAVS